MTDPRFDELASAHLDGATTPEEAARVDADPALRARVEELRQIRAQIGEVPPADPIRRDAAIAAALAAFVEDAGRAPVTSLTTVTARRGTSHRALQVLGAAAAVAVLALLAPVLGRLGTSSDDEATSFDSTGSAIEGSPDAAAEGGNAELEDGGDVRPTTSTAMGDQTLGSFPDLAALIEALSGSDREMSLESDGFASSGTITGTECPPTDAQQPSTKTAGARATVADEPVAVVVRTDAEGSRTLLVYRAADCTLMAERPLSGGG